MLDIDLKSKHLRKLKKLLYIIHYTFYIICYKVAQEKPAENDLLVRPCTFLHAAAYCHTRDATQR